MARDYLRLQMAKEIGPVRFGRLLAHFGSVQGVLSASAGELERVNGIGPQIAKNILEARDDEAVEDEIRRAVEAGVQIVCRDDPAYPGPLREAPDAPICIYVRGTLTPADVSAIGIVGTRRCSHYGGEQALRFAEGLVRAGYTIVSGLARGVDGHAHRGALAGGGRTLAILGNGLPDIYPPEHGPLAADVASSGAVISELPMHCAADAKNFPRRNRIIAGLSMGVIVIEAGKTSGALITAEVAREYGRKVFAIPGRIDQPDLSSGVNKLIKSGEASLVSCVDDVLEALTEQGSCPEAARTAAPLAKSNSVETPKLVGLNEQEATIMACITRGRDDADGIAVETGMSMAHVLSGLTSLELKSKVKRLPGNRFAPRR